MEIPDSVSKFILSRLVSRRDNHSLRTLNSDKSLIDFSSNDYLGFAQSEVLYQKLLGELSYEKSFTGSTGSRLISGNNAFTELLEESIASFHESDSALMFNSGYDANVGLFSSLPQRGDTVIADELIHASIIDGVRLSFANRFTFRHNDLNSLEEKLKAAAGRVFIAIESVYSMDGDLAPLTDIVNLAEKYGAALIVDEAHAVGIFGREGRGLVHQLNLQHRVFARTVTFGKALGCHGAAILGSDLLKSYLINFARSFIYTTAASPITHHSVKAAYELLQEKDFQSPIASKISFFKNETGTLYSSFVDSISAIQSLLIGGNEQAKQQETLLREKGYNVRAILSPTVPVGKERLRICLHTFNTEEHIRGLIKAIKENL